MILDKINAELKEAMLAKDTERLDVLRGIKAGITNELVSKGKTPQDTLTDDEIVVVINRMAKQRKDSIEQFEKGGRNDLAEKEKRELEFLNPFLPKMMSREEVVKIVEQKKVELGINDPSQKGKLMAGVMQELKGKADGSVVKEAVDSLF